MHRVVVLALDGVSAFDLATPVEVFGRAVDAQGDPLYEVSVAGPRRSVAAGPISLTVPHRLDRLAHADTVIVPGRASPGVDVGRATVDALRAAYDRGARLASICVGALDLAETGLLEGRRATTHWRATSLLARRHPGIDVDPSALYVDQGRILTSAGTAAGIDLCLHMVARDHGGAVAADAARAAVVPLVREGGQAQFIRDDGLGSTSLSATLAWIDEHAHEHVTTADLARSAAVSTRTLHRRFVDELGMPPSAWLARARVRRGQRMLETTDWPIDRVATESGLGSAANFRTHFASVVGTTPSGYRRSLALSARRAAPGSD